MSFPSRDPLTPPAALRAAFRSAAAALPGVRPRPAGALRCVSFNVHFGGDVDGKPALDRQLELLAEIEADMVCLQEVVWPSSAADPRDLSAALAELGWVHQAFAPAAQRRGGSWGNLIVATEPYTLLRQHALALGAPPGRGHARSALYVEVELDGAPVGLLNAHLDADDPTEQTRLAQTRRVLDFLKGRAPAAHAWLGDFNEVRRAELDDATWEMHCAADRARGLDQTHHRTVVEIEQRGYREVCSAGAQPAPSYSVWSGRRVDFAFLAPGWTLDVAQVHVPGTTASDHLPLVVDFAR